MPELADGERVAVQGSSGTYELHRVGTVYSCTCPAWRNQSLHIDRRTCKHLRAYRGAEAEAARLGTPPTVTRAPTTTTASGRPTMGEDSGRIPPFLLAQVWDNSRDLQGWWMSEKLDGVRAWWDGRQFISRQGNRFIAPDWFTEGLPDFPLDGELWGGRQRFQHTVGVVRRLDGGEAWRDLLFVAFDLPTQAVPFEERLQRLHDLFAEQEPPYAQAHTHTPCQDFTQLSAELDRVTALGGEGLMLRQPGSRYEAGRSWSLLKVKRFFDAEARVVDHQPGTGKHRGRLGALLVELGDGTRFAVGTGFTDPEREAPPTIGSWITFRYQELSTGGVPRFPSFVGVRTDLTPEQMSQPLPRPVAAPTPMPRPPSAARPPAPRPPAPRPPPAPFVPRLLQRTETGWALRLIYTVGSALSFWEVTVAGAEIHERYGREGRKIHTQVTPCASADEAERKAEKLAEEKLAKGYVTPT